jgi:hypothetical protein
MRQPARLRNHHRKSLNRTQRHNRWLLFADLALLTLTGNRCTSNCSRAKQIEAPGQLVARRLLASLPV